MKFVEPVLDEKDVVEASLEDAKAQPTMMLEGPETQMANDDSFKPRRKSLHFNAGMRKRSLAMTMEKTDANVSDKEGCLAGCALF